MTALFNCTEQSEHGTQCSCKLLAQAVGVDPHALSFDYCYRVLQKRWHMTCTHGEPTSTVMTTRLGERWSHVGRIDPVQAILMSNDPLDAGN